MNTFSLIVVGAGPAGTAAARKAAAAGLKTLLLERDTTPGGKPCGGLISRKTAELLARSGGTGLISNLNSEAIYTIRIHPTPDSPPAKTYEVQKPLGWTVKRKDFEQRLISGAVNAGAHFQNSTTITRLVQRSADREHHTLISEDGRRYASRYVIAADGVQSRLARQAGLKRGKHWNRGFGLVTQANLEVCKTDRNTAAFFFLPIPGGMGWLFPLGRNGYSIGAAGWYPQRKRITNFFPRFLRDILKKRGHHLPEDLTVRGGQLPAGGLTFGLEQNGLLLAGDAAGLVNPFSGEGIYYAVKSGRLAAESISERKQAGSLDRLQKRKYVHRCYREFYPEFHLSLLGVLLTAHRPPQLMKSLCRSVVFPRLFPALMTGNLSELWPG